MEGMHDHGSHMPDMNGTMMMPPAAHHHKMMMHMTFFWGTQSEILFSGWPGTRTGMYALAIVFVFALCILVEWLSHSRFLLSAKPSVATGVLRSLLHAVRMGLAYLAMLALMSFNGGVFLAAVAGHAVGFLAFASGAFGKQEEAGGPYYAGKTSADLPPMSC